MITNEAFKHYLVGDKGFDDEHWEILNILNDLSKDITREELVSKMSRARDLWISHAKREEEKMEKINFPYMRYHVIEHNELKKKLCEVANRVIEDKNYNPRHVINDFQHIICTHIDAFDMQITHFINKG